MLERLGDDEIAVLHLVATRALAGQATYGHLSVASDRRDFVREVVEEACDGCFYIAASLLQRRSRRRGTSRRAPHG
jgi:hypothetical protein